MRIRGDVKIGLDLGKITEVHVSTDDDGVPDLSGYDNVDQAWFNGNFSGVQEQAKFVELIPLYETVSKNHFKYDAKSIGGFNEKIIGKNGYLGHADPQRVSEGFGYRAPVARYVASRMTEVSVNGKSVAGSSVLAYISQTPEGQKHFQNIKEGTAGNVSIDGDAWLVKKGEVKHIQEWESVRSIDFVNNNTESVAGAGVTTIVKESFTEHEGSNDSQVVNSLSSTGDRNKIMEITLTSIKESAAGREVVRQIQEATATELVKLHEAALTEKDELVNVKSEELVSLTESSKQMQVELDGARKQNTDLTNKLATATLTGSRVKHLDHLRETENELAKSEKRDPDHRLVGMAGDRITESSISSYIVEGDDDGFAKSVNALTDAIDGELATLKEMAENFGGVAPKDGDDTPVKVTEGVQATSGIGINVEDIFAPAYAENKRVQSSTEN